MPRKKDWQERSVDYLQKLDKPRSKHFYRCGLNTGPCGARRVLNRELWQYTIPPQCYACGNRYDWRIDMSRWNQYKAKIGKYRQCDCDRVRHKHRPGRPKDCIFYEPPIPDFDAPGLAILDNEIPF